MDGYAIKYRTLFASKHPCLSVKRHKTVTPFGLHAFGIYALLILKMDVWQPKGVRPKACPCGQLIAVMCRCVQLGELCTYAHVGISCPSGRELQRCELDAFGCSSSMQWPHLSSDIACVSDDKYSRLLYLSKHPQKIRHCEK